VQVVLWRGEALIAPYDEGVTIDPDVGRGSTLADRAYPGRVPDETDPHELRDDEAPDARDVDAVNVVDEYRERAIDRFAQGSVGTATGASMIGIGKALGLHRETREAAEIREVGPPEPDDDDPIEVRIDHDHPENTRIVYRVPRPEGTADN
jgi:hypothetical protein